MVRRSHTRAPMYIMVMHKEAIYIFYWYSCRLHDQVKAHSKAKRKRIVFKQFIEQCDICDGEDYCGYFIINNHLPRAKCYRSIFTIIMQ
jgi:hypothetical protein